MKNDFKHLKKQLRDKLEVTFRRLTDAERREEWDLVAEHKKAYEFYKSELKELEASAKKPIGTGEL